MVKVLQAVYGDESTSTNVLSSVQGQKKITADSALLPTIQVGKTATITPAEEADITAQATKACGGANDAQCMNVQKARLRQMKLDEKMKEMQQKEAITGERLTLTILNEQTQRPEVVIVPKGKTYSLEAPDTTPAKSLMPTLSGTVTKILLSLAGILGTFLWVYSVVITYTNLLGATSRWVAYAATAAAVIIPYSGFLITLVFFAAKKYMETRQ